MVIKPMEHRTIPRSRAISFRSDRDVVVSPKWLHDNAMMPRRSTIMLRKTASRRARPMAARLCMMDSPATIATMTVYAAGPSVRGLTCNYDTEVFLAAHSKIDAQPAFDLLVQISRERLGAALGGDLAEAEHVDVARQFHHTPDIVVDQQDRHALRREQIDPLVDLLGDFWRKPDARLVDQAQPRPHQIGFRKLQHLLLAAREVPGLGVALVLQGRKFGVHVLEPAGDFRPRDPPAPAPAAAPPALRALAPGQMLQRQAQIVLDAHVGKQAGFLRDVADPPGHHP